METTLTSPPEFAPPERSEGCGGLGLLIAASLWVALVAAGRMLAMAFAFALPSTASSAGALPYALAQLVLTGLPLLLLAAANRRGRYAPVYRAWLLASLAVVLTLPVYLAGITAAQTQAVLHGILFTLYAALLWFFSRRRPSPPAGAPPASPRPALYLALAAAGLAALPWLAWGALGSPLDTLLQLLAALALGAAAGLLLERFLFWPLRNDGQPANFFLTGLAAGATLLILASATAFSLGWMQLLLMLVLPTLGWIAAAIDRLAPARPSAPLAWMVTLAAAAPMALIDPDELALVITASPGEILQWAFQAAGVALLVLLVLSLPAYLLSRRATGGRAPAFPLGTLAVLAWLAGAAVYLIGGQPGFYGEDMFVIFKEQADVSQAASIPVYAQRRESVYTTLVAAAERSQAGICQQLDRLGLDYTPYYLVNAIQMPGSPFLRWWLESRPEVDRILDSPIMRPLPEPLPVSEGAVAAPTSPQWNLTMIGADRVWNELGVTGAGVIVGQSDSGAQVDHPELADSYRGRNGDDNYNWIDPWYHTPRPTDIGGHGTHTLGSVLGNTTGVAPGAEWIACANLARNLGNPAHYLDCMQFMLAPYPQDGDPFHDGDPARGAQVLNNSWGCPAFEGCDPASLGPAVRALSAAGIFVVASAGNDGPACASLNTPPPIYPGAFAVGAIDRSGSLADFSSIGPAPAAVGAPPKPDVVAPGVAVLSAFPGGTYAINSGTSMAGPHVAGVVALMWSANPSLVGDIERTAAILRETARPYTGGLPACPGAGQRPSTAYGYGVVDAFAAVQRAMQTTTP